ncbi:MAG: ribosomal L7Ae/L30e/S12e/Gadd45 family protein [Firmicutes bacterium]|nr:ribosomal L7Ae/L30e/S12e/Gadd45 family protein [Bacillota bacterium]
MNEQQKARLAGYLGIAQRAGKIAAGDMLAKEALQRKKASLLVLAEDASSTVREELLALAGDKVPVLSWPDKEDLGRLVGKSRRGALALLDPGLAKAMLKVLDTTIKS